VLTGEKDMKDSCRVRRKLGDESGDTGDGVGNPWLDVRDGERPLTGGAERGGWCDVGEPRLEEDEAGGKREGFGIKMGGGARGSLGCDGRLGRAEEGAGLGDGRVRRESREGRRAMMDCGAERDDDGTGWSGERFVELSAVLSSGNRSLLELRFLSAARSSERNERSSVLASETGELASKGLVNWGGASEGEAA
jgi:hypothetical protein